MQLGDAMVRDLDMKRHEETLWLIVIYIFFQLFFDKATNFIPMYLYYTCGSCNPNEGSLMILC